MRAHFASGILAFRAGPGAAGLLPGCAVDSGAAFDDDLKRLYVRPVRMEASLSLFLCFDHADLGVVRWLSYALAARKVSVFGYQDARHAGLLPLVEELDVVFFLSPDSVVSSACWEWVDSALSRSRRVVPVVVRDVESGAVPEWLAAERWISMREESEYPMALGEIMSALTSGPAEPV